MITAGVGYGGRQGNKRRAHHKFGGKKSYKISFDTVIGARKIISIHCYNRYWRKKKQTAYHYPAMDKLRLSLSIATLLYV